MSQEQEGSPVENVANFQVLQRQKVFLLGSPHTPFSPGVTGGQRALHLARARRGSRALS